MSRTKTRKNRSIRRKTANNRGKMCCDVTMHGLHEWYDDKFEKLGYMILANAKGHTDKIACYKTSLHRLLEAIEHKITHVHEMDRKHDLEIMMTNVKILIDHVNKDFGV